MRAPKAKPQPKKRPLQSESKESEPKEMKETKAGPQNLRMTFVGGTTKQLNTVPN